MISTKEFTESERTAITEIAVRLASKVVKTYVENIIEWTAKNENLTRESNSARYGLYKKIIAGLNRVKIAKFSGFQELKFTDSDGGDHCLRYQLSQIDDSYKIELPIPPVKEFEKLMKAIFYNLDRFIDVARQYYQVLLHENTLLTDLATFLPDIDTSALKINPKNRAIYLDVPNYPYKIGALLYFVTHDGKPIQYNLDPAAAPSDKI